jgi:tight adherence protein C
MPLFYKILFLGVIFIVAVTLAYVALNYGLPTALDKRMATLFAPKLSPEVQAITSPLSRPVKRWIEPLASAAMNAETWLTSPLRIRFSNAGLNSPNVIALYFASKTLLTFLLPLLVLIAGFSHLWDDHMSLLMILILAASAAGYYLPNGVLSHGVKRRQNYLGLFQMRSTYCVFASRRAWAWMRRWRGWVARYK